MRILKSMVRDLLEMQPVLKQLRLHLPEVWELI